MINEKIGTEVALAEFFRICENWDLDYDVTEMKDGDAEGFENLQRKLVKAIRTGHLTVDDEGTPTFRMKYAAEAGFEELEALTFKIPAASAVATWDRFKDGQNVAKLNSYLGNMTKQPPAVFIKMDSRDWMVCQALAQIFLGS